MRIYTAPMLCMDTVPNAPAQRENQSPCFHRLSSRAVSGSEAALTDFPKKLKGVNRMAIHYVANIRHITCRSKSGKRRSPMSDIAYNSGQVLKDSVTGRQHSRPHTDGTQIIATDIVSADIDCKYGDPTVDSSIRRFQMYNELASLNISLSERIYAKTEVALANQFTSEQAKTVAKELALTLSKYLQRPVDYSIHMKPANGKTPANNHVHFAWPERKFQNGKWFAKSVSYYVDTNGKIIYDKHYKDKDGNDIRRPRIIKGTPEDKKYEKDESGNYIHQVRDAKGRRKWSMTNVEGLTPKDVKWIHQEVDRIINMYLDRFHIDDRVQRNDQRITDALKKAGLTPVHIGYKDAKLKSADYQEKVRHNARSNRYKQALTQNLTYQDIAEHNLQMAESAEQEADTQAVHAGLNRLAEEISVNLATTDYQDAVKDYVESELLPEEIFVENAVSELDKQYLTARRQTIYTATRFLQSEERSCLHRHSACGTGHPQNRAIGLNAKRAGDTKVTANQQKYYRTAFRQNQKICRQKHLD